MLKMNLQKPPGSHFGSNARNAQNELLKPSWEAFWEQGPEMREEKLEPMANTKRIKSRGTKCESCHGRLA